MADERPRLAIPAWQRSTQPRPPLLDDPVSSQSEVTPANDAAAKSVPEAQAHVEAQAHAEAQAQGPEEVGQPNSVPVDNTSAVDASSTLDANEIDCFKQQHGKAAWRDPSLSQPKQTQPAPPIITYPEFLVGAHQPPPLITPSGIVSSLYVAGGIAAILYGASRWVINPMVDTLSESRHEYLSHSQSKVDEFNERLSRIVSKLPEARKDVLSDPNANDAESETSDPTDLYHRDIGTQTSPLSSRRSSIPVASAAYETDPVTYQTWKLKSICDQFGRLVEDAEKAGGSIKDQQGIIAKLRHYLDGVIYGNVGALWRSGEDAIAKKTTITPKDDPIEELKKEIRGVKGVLLSAKRFPAASRPS